MAKKYAVSTIDRMRNAILKMLPSLPTQAERLAAAEDRLRTYLANGTEAEELEAEVEMRREGLKEFER